MATAAESSGAGRQDQLSTRQLAVLRLAAQGFSTTEIAVALALTPDHVRQVLLAIMRDLGTRSKLEAVLRAAQLGLLDLGP